MRKITVLRTFSAVAAAALISSANVALAEETPTCFGETATINAKGQGKVVGTSGPDVIVYGSEVYGRGGDDLICTQGGWDSVFGGGGNDKIDGGDNQDILDGGPGDDVLLPGSSGYSDITGGEVVSYKSAPGPVTVDALNGVATGYGTDTLGYVSGIIGSDYGDTLIAGDAWNGSFIQGEGGDDLIYSHGGYSDSTNFLAGGEGDDEIHGKGWVDVLRGDAGDDLLDGGSQPDEDLVDRVTYSPFRGSHGTYPGATRGIFVRLGKAIVTGEGTDTLVNIERVGPTQYDDIIWGDSRPNNLDGGGGNDIIRGRGGADFLGDYSGLDSLYGGGGPDTLYVNDAQGGDLADGKRGRDLCRRDPNDTRLDCERR
jgi:Ca2+-binding RTX toxin-like protein